MGVSKSSNLLESKSNELVPTTGNLPAVQNNTYPPVMNFNSNPVNTQALINGNNPLLLNQGETKADIQIKEVTAPQTGKSILEGPKGTVKLLTTWKILDDGTPYLTTVVVIPK